VTGAASPPASAAASAVVYQFWMLRRGRAASTLRGGPSDIEPILEILRLSPARSSSS
jgi:hypothetical protein